MKDERIERLAEVITGYSTGVKRGDVVLITASGEECQPLLKAVYRRCLERGAKYVEIQFSFPEVVRDFYRFGSQAQLAHFPAHRLAFLKQVDVSIGIAAEANSMVLAGVDQAKVLAHQRVLRPLLDWRVNRTRWVICRYPTHGMAQQAGMSLEELEDHVYAACTLDWAAVSRRQDPLRAAHGAHGRGAHRGSRHRPAPEHQGHPAGEGRRPPQPAGRRGLHRAREDERRWAHRLQLPDDPRRAGLRRHPAGLPAREGRGGARRRR